jgi:hypothetical protein
MDATSGRSSCCRSAAPSCSAPETPTLLRHHRVKQRKEDRGSTPPLHCGTSNSDSGVDHCRTPRCRSETHGPLSPLLLDSRLIVAKKKKGGTKRMRPAAGRFGICYVYLLALSMRVTSGMIPAALICGAVTVETIRN